MNKEKMIIYQVFTRLFGNEAVQNEYNGTMAQNGCGKMAAFTDKALAEIKKLGATHIWYTGILSHATQTDYSEYGMPANHPSIVKGKAGSPYAIRDYYDVDPDLAVSVPDRMHEFEQLVERTHNSGLKMIIDFVPNHVARQYHSTAKPKGVKDLGEGDNPTKAFDANNNFYYIPNTKLGGDSYYALIGDYEEFPAKATGNNRFDAYPNQNDWYETVKLNYGVDYIYNTGNHFDPVPDTWRRMKDILLFWAKKGIDGFRCDMAEMVPCEFWGWAIPQVKAACPDITFIAEVYNPNEYRNYIYNGHFDYLYDKVGLYDTLRALTCGYASASAITGCWQSVDDIQSHMLNFLENHDEQRIASQFFAGDARKAFPALIVSACLRSNPMMIYFGQELGEAGMYNEGFSGMDGRTTIFDYWNVDCIRRWSNRGKFNTQLLEEREKNIRAFYQKVLTLCNKEKAISEGEFFDLMYVNQDNWLMNPNKQYAFMRKYEHEVLLVVANFDGMPVRVSVNLPQHAFDCWGMKPAREVKAKELLTGTDAQLSFTPERPSTVDIQPYNAVIMKIKLPR